jgi:hypothetical protein
MSVEANKKTPSLTKGQVQAVISEKLEDTLYWLTRAYQFRPADEASERILLGILADIQKWQRTLGQVVDPDMRSGSQGSRGNRTLEAAKRDD